MASDAAAAAAARSAVPLLFKHDPELPISARRDDILQALRREQVLIVAGETGSGKSTQLPQYCLELGRGLAGLIAHTQPRRLAARALAARIAEEVGQPIGRSVGFRVRFADQASAATRLLLMTDGLLLAELASDPSLRRYDTIIVDEAHERTLNVDLLMGVLKRLLPRRPDLKVIVTSATLDVERIARFFGEAPIITVSGRSHPIEVRYRETAQDADDPDLPAAVLEAYQEIATEPGEIGGGDILVFLPGEREIRDVGEHLLRELPGVETLELYSRLSWEQQSRIFQRGARQRIVLATNVAETSITVPGIRAVIDSGLARISRYSPRNRLQRLPIEPISRASAEQRKGRCGRLGAGLCMRLYTQADFDARAAFTEPEILRTNLAALLLRLAADGLGEAENFPFIDAPDSRALNDGYRLLQELQALDAERRITRRGRAMARLPLDPRLGRALLESKRFRAESEVLAIVAGLSVPDVRLAAAGAAAAGEAADAAASGALEDGKSEFSSLVKVWRAYRKAREGPRRELKRWCKERGFSLLRLSEWDDVYAQVAARAADIGIAGQRQAASYTAVHRSLLAGFCTMVGTRGEEGVYLGTRGVHFHIFPGLTAGAAPAALGHGGEHRRDLAGVRAPRRRNRAAVDRGGGIALAEARVSRARLGRGTRGSGGARAHQLSRTDLERQPGGELWTDSAGRIPAHLRARGLGLPEAAPSTGLAAGERCGGSRGAADGGAAAHARSPAKRRNLRRVLRPRVAAAGVERRHPGIFHPPS